MARLASPRFIVLAAAPRRRLAASTYQPKVDMTGVNPERAYDEDLAICTAKALRHLPSAVADQILVGALAGALAWRRRRAH